MELGVTINFFINYFSSVIYTVTDLIVITEQVIVTCSVRDNSLSLFIDSKLKFFY